MLHRPIKDNVAYRWEFEGGNLKAAFNAAGQSDSPAHGQSAGDPRGHGAALRAAEYFAGDGQFTVWSSTQIPHLLRTQIAAMLAVPETLVRVIAPDVGGGFGSKLNVYPEEALVPWAAKRLGKPVKWSESRRENFQATIHGRDQIDYVEVAVKRDGTILGLRCRVIADLGRYYQLLTPLIPTLTGLMAGGCYKIPAVRMEIIGVLHQQDGHGRLPRRGTSGGDVPVERDRSGGPGVEKRSHRGPAQEFSQAHGFSVCHAHGTDLRQRGL